MNASNAIRNGLFRLIAILGVLAPRVSQASNANNIGNHEQRNGRLDYIENILIAANCGLSGDIGVMAAVAESLEANEFD